MRGINRFENLTWKNFEAYNMANCEAQQNLSDLTPAIKEHCEAILEGIRVAAAKSQTRYCFCITDKKNFVFLERLVKFITQQEISWREAPSLKPGFTMKYVFTWEPLKGSYLTLR